MKNKVIIAIYIVLSIFFSKCTFECLDNSEITEISKLELVCKVWGYLKYYHPGVGSGKIDWDLELFKILNELDSAHTKKDVNQVISNVLIDLSPFKTCDISSHVSEENVIKRINLSWLNDTLLLSNNNSSSLKLLYDNRQPYKNHYVSPNIIIGIGEFENEKIYSDSLFPSKKLRLLALFRYWNVINYFYPHLELNEEPWDSVLVDFIPQFIELEDTLGYHLKVLELTSHLNDGHVWTNSNVINLYLGIYSLPIKLRYIADKVVIRTFFSENLVSDYNIKCGDQILEINDIKITELINRQKKYYSFSNETHHTRRILEDLLSTQTKDTVSLFIDRLGERFTVKMKPLLLCELYQIEEKEEKNKLAYSIINDSTGYINLKFLDVDDVGRVMEKLMDKEKIIIDIRNYPKGVLYKLSEFFNSDSVEFVKILVPNTDKPGEFLYDTILKTGRRNNEYFQGKLILLVNEQTQSHAEFTVMCLQASPNVITIGSTTAGTDGNVSCIFLPGGIVSYFTGLGIEYPDGTPTQRIGIQIDYFIKPSIRDLQNNHDPLIEFAVKI